MPHSRYFRYSLQTVFLLTENVGVQIYIWYFPTPLYQNEGERGQIIGIMEWTWSKKKLDTNLPMKECRQHGIRNFSK